MKQEPNINNQRNQSQFTFISGQTSGSENEIERR
jgi:hypothetical protein